MLKQQPPPTLRIGSEDYFQSDKKSDVPTPVAAKAVISATSIIDTHEPLEPVIRSHTNLSRTLLVDINHIQAFTCRGDSPIIIAGVTHRMLSPTSISCHLTMKYDAQQRVVIVAQPVIMSVSYSDMKLVSEMVDVYGRYLDDYQKRYHGHEDDEEEKDENMDMIQDEMMMYAAKPIIEKSKKQEDDKDVSGLSIVPIVAYGGTSGSYQNEGNTFHKIFDGSLHTYFDAPVASAHNAFIVMDVGISNTCIVSHIRYAPRPTWEEKERQR